MRLGFEHGALWEYAGLEVAAERDQQLPRDGDHPDTALPGAPAEAAAVPPRQRAAGLAAHPAPGQFDREPAHARVLEVYGAFPCVTATAAQLPALLCWGDKRLGQLGVPAVARPSTAAGWPPLVTLR